MRPLLTGRAARCAGTGLLILSAVVSTRGTTPIFGQTSGCGPAAGTVVRHVPFLNTGLPQQPRQIAVDPTRGILYAAEVGDSPTPLTTISTSSICTGARVAQRRFAGNPGPIALDPAGGVLAVIVEGDTHSTLRLLDAATLASRGTVDLPPVGVLGIALAIDPGDGRIAVGDGGGGLLLVAELNGRVIRHLADNSAGRGIASFGTVLGFAVDVQRHRIAFRSNDGRVGIVDARTGALLHRMRIVGGSEGIAIDPASGQTVSVSSGDSSTPSRIVFLDTETGRLLSRSVLPGEPTDLAIDASSRRLFVPLRLPHEDRALATIDADAHVVRSTTTLAQANGSSVHFYTSNMVLDPPRDRLFIGVGGAISWTSGKYVGSGRLLTIDTRTGRILGSVPAGHDPRLLALDLAADRLVIGDVADGTITYLVASRLSAGAPIIVNAPVAPMCQPYQAHVRFARAGRVRLLHPGTPSVPQRDGPYLGAIAAGADGALWFATTRGVGRITTSGDPSLYRLPAAAGPIRQAMTGPAGNFWFTTDHGLGYIDGQGSVFTATFPAADRSKVQAFTQGPDGQMWLTESGDGPNDRVLHVSLTGDTQALCLPSRRASPLGIAAGPDGNVWVAESGNDQIARLRPSGGITEFPLGSVDGSQPGFAVHYIEYIAPASHGALWFTEIYGNAVGRISAAGAVTEFQMPTVNAGPLGIATGPDGAVWVTEVCANAIARVSAVGQVTEYPLSATEHGTGRYCLESP